MAFWRRYDNAWKILEASDATAGEALLTPEDTACLMGGTLQSLFPGAWE
jgi:hypothetical protein